MRHFVFAMNYEVNFISVMLRASCNEIESNIVKCRAGLTKAKNVKTVQTDMDRWYQACKKAVIRLRKKQSNVSSRINNL